MEKKTKFQKLHTFLSSTLFVCISASVSAGMTYACYYERHVKKASFQTVYAVSIAFLLLAFLVFLIAYRNKEAELNKLIKQTLPGYFFFAAFVLITLILRG